MEVNIVLWTRESDTSVGDVDLIPETSPTNVLREPCGFCIKIIDGKVHFTHHTVKEFLQYPPGEPPSSQNPWMEASLCLPKLTRNNSKAMSSIPMSFQFRGQSAGGSRRILIS